MFKLHSVEAGKERTRISYGRIKEVLEMPNLIEIQKKSYEWFLEEGLDEVLKEISPITDFSGNLELYFIGFTLDSKPKYTIEECKERDTTYSCALKVKVRLLNKSTGEVKEQDIFIGDFPLMTDTGNFIINGAERVIVSQIVRSPGIYYTITNDKYKEDIKIINSTVIPNRGAWLEYEIDSNDVFSVRIDRNRKVPISVLLRALGYSTNADILELLGEDERILMTLEKDTTADKNEALIEIYKKLRPGEPPTIDSATTLINNLFFDPRRYDLAKVGRYKYNKKLAFSNRVDGKVLAEDVVNNETGEVIAAKGQILDKNLANTIQDAGVIELFIEVDGRKVKVISNGIVDITKYVSIDLSDLKIKERVVYSELKKILEEAADNQDLLRKLIAERISLLIPNHITKEDIVGSINYCINLIWNIGNPDDIDHLGNRRLRCVGELLQNQFRIGFSRMERVIRERMNIQDVDSATPQLLINIRPVSAAIREFFGSSQLSQFMDQTNPLGELTHKRRLSALGPGGLSRERAGFEVRDVHYSHYGRMCPIETPEGPNIGLINSLSTYARVNEYGFIEAPYRIVDKKTGCVTDQVRYFTADEEDGAVVAQATEPVDIDGRFINSKITVRIKDDITQQNSSKIDLMDVSPRQLISVATAMIPFLENDDANRALMGSNMQRQAVPLLVPEAPIVGTGIEYKAAKDSGVVILSKHDGVVKYSSSDKIIITSDEGRNDEYRLSKFSRSNQGTCINQRPRVKPGERVKKGEVIADGPSTEFGEISLGRNILIGFITWEGYNYEDAVLISEKLVKEDVYTSIHIEEYEIEARDTKLGPEEITRDIPQVGEDALKDLDERGIIRIGAEIRTGDILVGKVTPKGETELTAEERLLRAIFGEKAREVRDTSLRVPHGEAGIVVDVKVFKRENGDELSPGVNELVRVYIAQKRKISVGDKMAGRHGNKGVISRILPEEDMPFLDNGVPLQIVLNPLGVPSRMNIGQVLEMHLGVAAKVLGGRIATAAFDGAKEQDIIDTLNMANARLNLSDEEFREKYSNYLEDDVMESILNAKKAKEDWMGVNINETGKLWIRDGRTGEYFDNPVTVGYMYYLKLFHLVDDKIHARSTGPYSLVTQQPLGGKAQFGGQRFGEMEVWALEAYGAAYTLQEILTVKSDDVVGRVKTYESIVKGENVPEPGIPESFKVLVKELQSLCLDVKLLTAENEEIIMKESIDDEDLMEIDGMEDVLYPVPQTETTESNEEIEEEADEEEKDLDDINVIDDSFLTNYVENDDDELSSDDELSGNDLLSDEDLVSNEDLLDFNDDDNTDEY